MHEIDKKPLFWHFLLPFAPLLPSHSALFRLTVHPHALRIPFSCKVFQKGGARLCTIVHGFRGGRGVRALFAISFVIARVARPHVRTEYTPARSPRDFAADPLCIKNRLAPGRGQQDWKIGMMGLSVSSNIHRNRSPSKEEGRGEGTGPVGERSRGLRLLAGQLSKSGPVYGNPAETGTGLMPGLIIFSCFSRFLSKRQPEATRRSDKEE